MIKLEKILTIFIGIGAVVGAVMMWIDPTGIMWGGEPLLEFLRAKMPWPDIFFRNFIPSGFVLLFLNGITQFVAAFLLFKKHPFAQWAILACGIIRCSGLSLNGGYGVSTPSATSILCSDWRRLWWRLYV